MTKALYFKYYFYEIEEEKKFMELLKAMFKFANEFSLEQRDEAREEAVGHGWGKYYTFIWGAFVRVVAFGLMMFEQLIELAGDILID